MPKEQLQEKQLSPEMAKRRMQGQVLQEALLKGDLVFVQQDISELVKLK